MSLLFLLLGLASATVNANAAWSLNDVSFLLPLQDADAPALLFHAAETAELGAILPRPVYNLIGRLDSFEDPAVTFGKLRVVGIRIDPCFLGGAGLRECRAMIRFVWQPVNVIASGKAMTDDAAIHTFYDLPRVDFDRFAADLAALRAQSGASFAGAPLGVHPVIAREGLHGPFYTRLKKLIFRYIGAKALTRMTFMKLSGGGSMWDFGGFNIENGTPVAISIPRVDRPRQVFVNGASTSDSDFFNTQLAPAPKDPRNVNWVIGDSKLVRAQDRPELVIANVIASRELENPRIAKTDATDCVSCHAAQPARIWAIKNYPQLELDKKYLEKMYVSDTHSLANTSRFPELTAKLRAFGYFGSEPAISRRTIHESAEVADAMNRASFRRRLR